MGDVLGYALELIVRALMELVCWIPTPRLNSIRPAWAWAITSSLVIGGIALVAAIYLGHPWLYHLALGVLAGTLGLVCIATVCTRASRSD